MGPNWRSAKCKASLGIHLQPMNADVASLPLILSILIRASKKNYSVHSTWASSPIYPLIILGPLWAVIFGLIPATFIILHLCYKKPCVSLAVNWWTYVLTFSLDVNKHVFYLFFITVGRPEVFPTILLSSNIYATFVSLVSLITSFLQVTHISSNVKNVSIQSYIYEILIHFSTCVGPHFHTRRLIWFYSKSVCNIFPQTRVFFSRRF